MLAALVVAGTAVLARGGRAARADGDDHGGAGPRLVLDGAELEPSWFPDLARLRLHVTAVQLEGSIIEVPEPDSFVLTINGSRRREPYLEGRWAESGGTTAVVVVIETGWEMRDDLDAIREAVGHLIEALPDGTQLAVMTYGESVSGGHRLVAARAADRHLDRIEADSEPADPELLSAIQRAISTLRRATPDRPGAPMRRILVVVSDGKDVSPEPSHYRQVGERAQRDGVSIDTLAYSPVNNRRPLLGLGELSKRSHGTFRWVRSREGFRPQVDTLIAEIGRQYVLTFFVPAAEVLNKRLAVTYRDLTSNDVHLHAESCGGATCAAAQFCAAGACVARQRGGGSSLLGWLLWLGGGIVGLVVLVGVIGAVRSRRAGPLGPAAPMPGGPMAGAPPGPGAGPGPGQVAGGRIVPMSGMPQPQPVAAAAAGPGPVLLVMAGPFQGQRLALRHGFLVGSARGCDLFLPDPQVAPHHAIFHLDQSGSYTLVDRGGGTFVNGVRIMEARLGHGNLIRIGNSELRYLTQ